MAVVPPDGFVPLGGRALGGPVLVDVVAVGGVPLGVVPPTPVDDAPAPVNDGVVAAGGAVPRACFGLGAVDLCLFCLGASALGTLCAELVDGPTMAIRSPLVTPEDREGDEVALRFPTTRRDP